MVNGNMICFVTAMMDGKLVQRPTMDRCRDVAAVVPVTSRFCFHSISLESNMRTNGSIFSRGGDNGAHGRDQLHLNDYMPSSQGGRTGTHQQQQYYDDEYDYRRRAPPSGRSRGGGNTRGTGRMNNFDFEDYDRPSSYNRGRNMRNNYGESQAPPRRQRPNYDQYQNDDETMVTRQNQPTTTSDQTYHRERNFTNSHYQQKQQQRTTPKMSANDNSNVRDDQRRPTSQHFEDNSGEQERNQRVGKVRPQRFENSNEPPRRQTAYNNRSQGSTQARQSDQEGAGSSLSAEAPSFERPKRYSNMRSNASNNAQQQQQQMPMPMPTYHDQRSNYYEQSLSLDMFCFHSNALDNQLNCLRSLAADSSAASASLSSSTVTTANVATHVCTSRADTSTNVL
jgi:hypothetical protein